METIEDDPTAEPQRPRSPNPPGIGGSAIEAMTGTIAVVLSILGLTGRFVVPFASIAVIAAGTALVFEAIAMAAHRRSGHLSGYQSERRRVLEGSVGVDSIAGIVAVALGLSSLAGYAPMTLLPIATLILGAGILLSAGGPTAEREPGRTRAAELARDGLVAASSIHFIVGTAALILSVIALLGHAPLLMTLIATLSIGAAELLAGASLTGRINAIPRHGSA